MKRTRGSRGRRRKGSGLISASDRNVIQDRQRAKSVPTPFSRRRALSARAIAHLAAERVALPSSYAETSLVVFPVQPYAVHACWEVTPETLEQGQRDLGAEADAAEAVLRFHGASDERAPGSPRPLTFDVMVDVGAGDWYVDLWRAGQAYVVELGFRAASGRFRPLTRPTRVATPRGEPAPVGAGSAEIRSPEGAPVHETGGGPATAERTAQGGGTPRRGNRAAAMRIGGAGPAAGDLTGLSEAAFQAGISSRR